MRNDEQDNCAVLLSSALLAPVPMPPPALADSICGQVQCDGNVGIGVMGTRNYKVTATLTPGSLSYSPSGNVLDVGGVFKITPSISGGTIIRVLFRQADFTPPLLPGGSPWYATTIRPLRARRSSTEAPLLQGRARSAVRA